MRVLFQFEAHFILKQIHLVYCSRNRLLQSIHQFILISALIVHKTCLFTCLRYWIWLYQNGIGLTMIMKSEIIRLLVVIPFLPTHGGPVHKGTNDRRVPQIIRFNPNRIIHSMVPANHDSRYNGGAVMNFIQGAPDASMGANVNLTTNVNYAIHKNHTLQLTVTN